MVLMIANFTQANNALKKYIPSTGPRRYTLDRMRLLMDYLGNPQNKLRVIHVAGTSGKTSTAYYVASLLQSTGVKTGLSVSPHIDVISERAQINLKPLAEAEYCALLSEFLQKIESSKLNPTYFEVLVAFAYWLFAKQRVEYAVVEVGLGGLLDSTNVVNRQDKVCVITDIGLDHTEILGNTISKIASQKAGIIGQGNTVILHKQNPEVMNTINRKAKNMNANIVELNDSKIVQNLPKHLPSFQTRNFNLAYGVYTYVSKRDNLSQLNDKPIKQAAKTHIPARMEIITYKQKLLILDGSHNQQKLHALTDAIQSQYGNKSINLLVSFGNNKRSGVKRALTELRKLSDNITLTSFKLGQNEPRKPIDINTLESLCENVGFQNISVRSDPAAALTKAMDSDAEILLITGSFYLLNHIRRIVF